MPAWEGGRRQPLIPHTDIAVLLESKVRKFGAAFFDRWPDSGSAGQDSRLIERRWIVGASVWKGLEIHTGVVEIRSSCA